jgi:hypothetical protein
MESRGDQIIEANIEAGNDQTGVEEQNASTTPLIEENTNANITSQETEPTQTETKDEQTSSPSSNEA